MSVPTLRPAAVPRRPATVGFVGLLLSVAFIALGALAVYDGMALQGWVRTKPLLTPLFSGQEALLPGTTAVVAGVVAAILGLLLLWVALRPARRRGGELEAGTQVWLTWADIARLAASVAEQQDGVLTARASASSRRVQVVARTTTGEVEPALGEAVAEALSGLRLPPRVAVRAVATQGDKR